MREPVASGWKTTPLSLSGGRSSMKKQEVRRVRAQGLSAFSSICATCRSPSSPPPPKVQRPCMDMYVRGREATPQPCPCITAGKPPPLVGSFLRERFVVATAALSCIRPRWSWSPPKIRFPETHYFLLLFISGVSLCVPNPRHCVYVWFMCFVLEFLSGPTSPERERGGK